MAGRIWRGVSVEVQGDPFAWVRANRLGPDLKKIMAQLVDRWQALAAERIKNPVMLQRFHDAMDVKTRDASEKGFLLELRLKGMWGNALERGWIPCGPTFADGYDQYDGNLHDMRDLLLQPGKGLEETNGVRWRRVRISQSLSTVVPNHGSESPLQFVTRRMQEAQVPSRMARRGAKFYRRADGEEAPSRGRVGARQKRVARALDEASQAFGPNRRFGPRQPGSDGTLDLGLPKTIDRAPANRRLGNGSSSEHAYSMMARARVHRAQKGNPKGNEFSVVRTISEGAGRPGSWMSRGFPPANTFRDVGALAGELVREFFRPK